MSLHGDTQFYQVVHAKTKEALLQLLLPLGMLLAYACSVRADFVFTPFGSFCQGGIANGQTFTFGSGGEVYEIDSFVNIAGQDLNGSTIGTSAQLSRDALPGGLSLSFTPTLSGDAKELTLQYRLTNNSGGPFADLQFFSFVDAQIDVPVNTYFNEAGEVFGSLGSGAGDADPDSFEIDEPGYVFGNVFQNLLLGSLDNTNSVTASSPDDVSLALGFQLGTLLPGQEATIDVFLSEIGTSIGGFSLRHFDADPSSLDALTLSGQGAVSSSAAVPEPSSLLLASLGILGITLSPRRVRAKFSGRR